MASKNKKASSIIEKVKEWIAAVYKELKTTFSKWSRTDLENLSVEEFSNLTLRDLSNGLNPKNGHKTIVESELSQSDDGIRFRDGESEEDRIVSDAKANGTYMKAPNGKPSKLDQHQWVQVRTRAFKDWFGDWETNAIARIAESIMATIPIPLSVEELQNDESKVAYDAFKNKSAGWRRTVIDWAVSITPEIVATQFGEVEITRSGIKNVVGHVGGDLNFLSLIHIEDFLKHGVLYDRHKEDDGYTYYNYAHRIEYNGGEYIMRGTVREDKNGKRIYDHEFTDIKKIEELPTGSGTANAVDRTPQSQAKVLNNILNSKYNPNVSRIVDENGEPMVVYHDTNSTQFINRETGENWDELDWRERLEWEERDDWDEYWEEQDFYTFDNKSHGRRGIEMPAFFFTPNYDEYHEYGDRTIAAFLNIRNPKFDPEIKDAGVYDDAGEMAMDALMDEGYDGFIRTEDGQWYETNAFHPNQIKSADENNGDFSTFDNDIRYRDGEKSEGERLLEIQSLNPIEVNGNSMSKKELKTIYNNLPDVKKDGRDIIFFHSAFGKIYKDGGLFGQVIPVLDQILAQSVLAYSEKDSYGGLVRPDGTVHKEHPNTLSFDNYVGKVNINGEEYYVRITIQNDKGNRSGMHSCFVTNVDVYKNTAIETTSTEIPRVKSATDGIVDAKLQEFFERAKKELEGDERYRMGDSADTFRDRQRAAVANRGTVMPGLNEAEVNVIAVPKHNYRGREILTQAVDVASQRYAEKTLEYNNFGVKFEYVIKPRSLKYAANHSNKSDNVHVHAAIMNKLDEVISHSIEVMEHADVHRIDGKRIEENGYAKDSLMHRFVGAVNIGGQVYRVITTIKEYADSKMSSHHTYEVTKIEVLDVEMPNTSGGTTNGEMTRLGIANILQNSKIHNKSGEDILRESEERHQESSEQFRSNEDKRAEAERQKQEKATAATEMGQSLGVEVEVVEDTSNMTGRQRRAKGWFDPKTGKVVVIPGNHANVADIRATILHEIVGHKGLQAVVGEKRFFNNIA